MKQAEVVLALAYIQPATRKEIAYVLNDRADAAGTPLRSLWEHNLVLKRTRPTNERGTDPIEYRLNEEYMVGGDE